MNLKKSNQEEPEVNLTPLIDVVFLLLIFFMVSTTFKKDQAISIELPESTAAPKTAPSAISLEIVITAEGKYFINRKNSAIAKGKKGSIERNQLINPRFKYLKRAIKRVSGGNSNMKIAISADSKSPHEAFVRVMDALSQLGFRKIAIVTVPRKR